MSFFGPTISPDGLFVTYHPIHPPSHPCSCYYHDTQVGFDDGDPLRPDPGTPTPCLPPPGPCPRPSPPGDENPISHSRGRPGRPISPRPCIPPHGPCPGPIPPSERERSHTYNNPSIPISHSAQQGLPIAYPNSPPRYTPNSPPLYKPLPSPSEGTLLLAPPPSFLASTCPYVHSANPSELPTHSCPHCYSHSGPQPQTADTVDWMVALLIILNLFVWGAVAWGYICEYTDGDFQWGDLVGSCVGGQGAAGWGKICQGEECRWAFVDC
ncbi:uncharacterized protein L199_000064 [Kwoniella botswanensis]|uniref:uncharacterized protein n=1 Tax=Kwoniella botswanensis TaxID=1268659 RepID=UPI00315D08A5